MDATASKAHESAGNTLIIVLSGKFYQKKDGYTTISMRVLSLIGIDFSPFTSSKSGQYVTISNRLIDDSSEISRDAHGMYDSLGSNYLNNRIG